MDLEALQNDQKRWLRRIKQYKEDTNILHLQERMKEIVYFAKSTVEIEFSSGTVKIVMDNASQRLYDKFESELTKYLKSNYPELFNKPSWL